MKNTEPTYTYVKGEGWIPRIGGHILTAEDCKGSWIERFINGYYYQYPKICESWKIHNSIRGLKVGDIVPYTGLIKIVCEIRELEGNFFAAYCHYANKDGVFTPCDFSFMYLSATSSWYAVARDE